MLSAGQLQSRMLSSILEPCPIFQQPNRRQAWVIGRQKDNISATGCISTWRPDKLVVVLRMNNAWLSRIIGVEGGISKKDRGK